MRKIVGCEMCGTQGFLLKVNIEGTQLNVCKNCSKYGKVIGKVYTTSFSNKIKPQPKKVEVSKTIDIVVEDYPILLKDAREKIGLKQEDVAKLVSEKESLIHKMENGTFRPSIPLAKKLEKFYGIKLIEEYEEKHENQSKIDQGIMTIGDKIKIRKRS